MKVTSKTKYRNFMPYEPFLDEASVAELKAAAEQSIKPCHTLTLDEFFGILNEDLSLLGDMRDPSVYQVYWVYRFKDFVGEFTKACIALAIKDEDTEGLQTGCVKIAPQESMLIYMREYFGLHSFSEAGQRTIGEYILARKDTFNKWKVRKNQEKKQLAKLKKK